MGLVPSNVFRFSSNFVYWLLHDGASFVDDFLLFVFRVCHAFLSIHRSLVVTCWESAYFLALDLCLFTFPCGVLGQLWYLIVSIPDRYLPYLIYSREGPYRYF